MAWTPANKTIDAQVIADNLLAYFAANQVEALAWASGSTLKPFKNFSATVANRSVPVYPAIAFSDDNDAVDYAADNLQAAYSVTFEVMIQNADPSTAIQQARLYLKAIVSMIRNIPHATLSANSGAVDNATTLQTIETGFEPIKSNETQTDFLQMFQVRATFALMASAYS